MTALRCTAPTQGHTSIFAAAKCPACGIRSGTALAATLPPLLSARPPQQATERVVDTLQGELRVTPGHFDAAARLAYANGQDLALAVALSAHAGTDKVLIAYDTETDYEWDGDDVASETEHAIVHHAWGLDADGRAWDFEGSHDRDTAIQSLQDFHPGCTVREVDIAEATEYFALYTPEPDYELAASFAPSIAP